MSINIIVAVSQDWAIGVNGDLIWHLREDLKYFKSLTMGHPIVMGRNTWQSLPGGALPGRRNIVVSRNKDFKAPCAEVFSDIPDAICAASQDDSEVFIIGGGEIYKAAISRADRLYITKIFASAPQADTFFPIPEDGEWRLNEQLSSAVMHSATADVDFRFEVYDRVSGQ